MQPKLKLSTLPEEGEHPTLSVAAYNAAEEAAWAQLPNRVVEMFAPVMFEKLGYPTRVAKFTDLWKFVDVMHERRFDDDYRGLLGGLTRSEFELVARVLQFVAEHGDTLEHKIAPRGSLLRAVNLLRHIRFIYGDRRPTILEVGPGSGYLGAMLILEGYPYLAIEVAQAFYLQQHHMWSRLGPNLIDLALEDRTLADLRELDPGTAVHIPWWKFFVRDFATLQLGVDVVSPNHVLCEMHPRALLYLLRAAQRMLANCGDRSGFLFEGWGYGANVPRWWVNSRFHAEGFGICHHDEVVTAITSISGGGDICKFPRAGLPNVQDTYTIASFGEHKIGEVWEPSIHGSMTDPWSRRILVGRRDISPDVELDEVDRLYDELFPDWRNQFTDDAVFTLLDTPG